VAKIKHSRNENGQNFTHQNKTTLFWRKKAKINQHQNFPIYGRCLSTRTVRNRLKSAGLKSRRVIKRPLLVDRHQWCLARCGWNLRTWRKIHWSDESRFLLHATDGRMRVWRHKNTAYTPRNIQPTVPYGGGSVMVWGCISHDCKLDLVTIQGNLTGDQYIRDFLQPVVVPHFDNHSLATRPVYMDDNARPHRSRAVTSYLQSEAVTSVPWPAMRMTILS
jgi:hypothetical protein